MLKNLDLRLKDVDPFYFDKKFRSTSKKDVDSFYFDEKFISTSKKDVDLFYFDKKINLVHADL